MKDLKQFNIQFVGLKEGSHFFEYEIDNTFFDLFNYDDFLSSKIDVKLNFVKKSTLFELEFSADGFVHIPCDTTNEPFDLKIDSEMKLIVKFGPEFNDDFEDIIILPHEAFEINISQYIYEMIVLSLPQRRVHPKVVDGTMESETLKKLAELNIKKEENVSKETDPRWDKLKNIITEKKT